MLQLGIATATIGCIDLAAFFLVPAHLTRGFSSYRTSSPPLVSEDGGLEAPAPKDDYHVAHPMRGFDIGPNRRGVHSLETVRYPIWSNRFGCFDRDWEAIPKGYVYFAGDSFTWGYAPFDGTFPSLFEAQTGSRA